MKAFLEFLAKISVTVPQGILVFFPSYNTQEEYRKLIMTDLKIKKALYASKDLFFENPHSDISPQFKKYQNCCQNEKGGIFFLIFRGKFSEGLDFKNELARLVIIMGIPFSNIKDIKLEAKRQYQNEVS